MDKILLTEKKKIMILLEGLRLSESNAETDVCELIQETPTKTTETVEDEQCLSCNYVFITRDDQTDHYKSDWHRYNLKLRLNGASPVPEKEFDDIIDEISSISGSESEIDDNSDSEEERTKLDKAIDKIPEIKQASMNDLPDKKESKRSPKLFFTNSESQILSIYKCILPLTSLENEFCVEIPKVMSSLQNPVKCCIILLSSGHFAAAVFENGEIKVHKTFHRYIQRKKQGSVQSIRDNAGSAPKSGGATLRRYNEMALTTDIQTLLSSWKTEYLESCSHIFLRTPHYSKSTFYNGKSAPLKRKDPRIKGIPLPTRRPTFNELKRVYKELFSIEVHDDNGIKIKVRKVYKSPLKINTVQENVKTPIDETVSSDKVETRSPKSRKKKLKRNKNNENDHESPIPTFTLEVEPVPENMNENERITDELFTVCKIGDLDGLKAILSSIKCEENGTESENKPSILEQSHVNQPMGKDGNTLLHITAKAGHRTIVRFLLEFGANPALNNKLSLVPYSVSSDKAMRNTFRKFMSEYPDKYDYKTSLIPEPLTEDKEKEKNEKQNQKKKAQKALRKKRMKIQKAEKEKKELEEQERNRFASLSDREKRAIAAERRFAKQLEEDNNSTQSSVKRCWLCGESLLGKIPFEYFDFQFCSIKCLKKHKATVTENK